MTFQFLHTADIHLDSPQLHLERYDGAPVEQFRAATRHAFENLVDLAIERSVAFVLIAGDLYDGECRDVHTLVFFRQQMNRLREQGIRVVLLQGNHDAATVTKKAFRGELPENCYLLRTDRAETVTWPDLQVAIHGQGFADREVTADLSVSYPEPLAGWLNIGMLHTNCGNQDAHDPYAPSTVAGLSAKGYHYWALGHIHKQQILCEAPWIAYPGNIQGRHIREAGPKGCLLVSVEGDRILRVEPQVTDVVRWQLCRVDATNCGDARDVVRAAWDKIHAAMREAVGRPLAVRCEIHGSTPAHRQLHRTPDHWEQYLRDAITENSDAQVWLEKISWRTKPLLGETTTAADQNLGIVNILVGFAPLKPAEFVVITIRQRCRIAQS